MRSHGYCFVNGFDHVRLDHITLAEDSYRCAITVKQGPVLGQLQQFELCHSHQSVDFVFRALEVLDTECVDGHDFDTCFVADFEYLGTRFSKTGMYKTCRRKYYPGQRLEPHVVSFYGLNVLFAGEAPVTVHDECDMLWNGTLPKGANEQLSQLSNGPSHRRR